jgi:Protein of unknown function (DUF3592)
VFITYVALFVIGGILLVADLFIGAVLVTNVSGALWLAMRGVETTGRVTLVEERRPGSAAQVQVAYDTPGGTFRTEGRSQRPQLGGQIPVRYHPAKPAFATTLTRPWRRTLVGIPTVVAVMAASVGMVTSAVWYFHGSHTSLQVPLAGASFLGALALASAYGSAGRYAALLRWRRMVQADGKVLRFSEKSPVGPGILVSFTSADGREEFWARAGSVDVGSGDTVAVYYDPAKAATSATVQTARDVRAIAIAGTVFTLAFGALAIFSLTRL